MRNMSPHRAHKAEDGAVIPNSDTESGVPASEPRPMAHSRYVAAEAIE